MGQCTTHRSLCRRDQDHHSRKVSSSLHFPTDVPQLRSTAKRLIHRQTSESEMMWEVLSNEDPENQVRTTELLELTQRARRMWLRGTFNRPLTSSTASLSSHEAHSFCSARVKASRSSRVRLRIDTSTRRFWHDLDLECTHELLTRESSQRSDTSSQRSEPGDGNRSIRISKTSSDSSSPVSGNNSGTDSDLNRFCRISSSTTVRGLLETLVFASPQDHRFRRRHFVPVSTPSVNCCCAGQVQL